MELKHTPTPWLAKREGFSTVYVEARLRDGWLQELASCGPTEVRDQQEANAAFIVRACNSHEQLVAALREACDLLIHTAFHVDGADYGNGPADRIYDRACAALAAAGAA